MAWDENINIHKTPKDLGCTLIPRLASLTRIVLKPCSSPWNAVDATEQLSLKQKETFSNTNADVGGNSANIDIGHVLLLDDVLQAGLGELLVVKEGGVGVDIGVGALARNSRSDLCLTHRKCLRGANRARVGKGGQVGRDVTDSSESQKAGL